MITYNKADIEKAGYAYAGITIKCDLVGHWQMRKAAMYRNVTLSSLHAFRTAPGRWAVHYTQQVQSPYKDEAILP